MFAWLIASLQMNTADCKTDKKALKKCFKKERKKGSSAFESYHWYSPSVIFGAEMVRAIAL